jgi:hypothetical protein
MMFLDGISTPSLSTLEIWSDFGTSREWSSLFQFISERMSDVPLSGFDFSGQAEYCDDDPCPAPHIFRPLYIFRNVRTFDYGGVLPLMQDDCPIMEMAAAWPNLTSLILDNPYFSPPEPTGVTVGGLALLAVKCQNLSELRLDIDGRKIGPLLENTCGVTSNIRVQCISLGRSPIEDANVAEVAMVLARALPNLRTIQADPSKFYRTTEQGRYMSPWQDVQALVCQIRGKETDTSHSEQG